MTKTTTNNSFYHRWYKELKLAFLAAGIYVCFLTFSYYQEHLARGVLDASTGEKVKFPSETVLLLIGCAFNALFTRLLIALRPLFFKVRPSSSISSLHSGLFSPSKQLFVRISASYIVAMLTSNLAIRYISYPAQVLGKSLKPVAVIVANTLINRTRYPLSKYLAVVAVCGGIALYSYDPGRASGGESSTPLGLALIFASLFCDGLTASAQDQWIKHEAARGCAPDRLEAQYITNLYSSMGLVGISAALGAMTECFEFLLRHPHALADILMFSLTFSLGQCFIYALLAEHGSLVVSVVTTTRKFFSILISVLLLNPGLLGGRQWIGISLVFVSLGYDMIASHHSKSSSSSSSSSPSSSSEKNIKINHEKTQ